MISLTSLIAGRPLAVYGYGNSYHFLNAIVFTPLKIKVDYLIDKKFTEYSLLDTVSFVPPKDLGKIVPTTVVVIVAVGNFEEFKALSDELKKHGFTEIIYFQDIYEYNLVYSSKSQSKKIQKYFQCNSDLIEEVRKFFTDNESLSLYDAIISTHLNQKLEKIPSHSVQLQYFDNKLFKSGSYDRLLQVGAYDGDTLVNLANLGVNPSTLWALEPDENNFLKLKQNLPESWKSSKINLLQMAASNRSDNIFFDSNNGPTSRIGNGTSTVKSIKLDEYSFEKDPTFIIIDVEGYERQVLTGLKKTIRRCKPVIAIATYHFPTDILKIPIYINSVSPYKNLKLRNYSGCVVDTVMYFND